MSYPHPPPLPKHQQSSFSSGSSNDPFNNYNRSNPSIQQLPYSDQQQYNPYAQSGAQHNGAGAAGVPPSGGQYAPYYDTESEMGARLESGGAARETWATQSESAWSQDSEFVFEDLTNPRRRAKI